MTTAAHLRRQDAGNRSWRTILQGAAAVAILAAVTALLDWLQAGEFSWRTLGISATTAVLTAVLAYLHRTVLDPSGVPSALPPTDPGPPAEPVDERGTSALYVCLVVLLVVLILAIAVPGIFR